MRVPPKPNFPLDSSQSLDKSPITIDDDFSSATPHPPFGLLVRLIDDFLYVSTSVAATKSFVQMMEKENTEYGCVANKEKTKTSFSTESQRPPVGCIHAPGICSFIKINIQDGKVFIPWCGFLINVTTFEFQADYTRYKGNGKVLIYFYQQQQ
jgi:hypothetical protein